MRVHHCTISHGHVHLPTMMYVHCMLNLLLENIEVYFVFVFDGYEDGTSTKYVTHLRRTGACIGAKVNFSDDMAKEDFLSKKDNQQRFIHLLHDELHKAGCVYNAKGDADKCMVQTTT